MNPIKKLYQKLLGSSDKREEVEEPSDKGEEIEEYNYNKKFESWKKLNKVNINFDKWRTNFEKWRKDLRFR